MRQSGGVTRDDLVLVGRWAIDEYALMVNDLDNGSQTTFERSSAEEYDAADLDVPPVARLDVRVTHFN